MNGPLQLNVPLLRRRVPNLSAVARSVGLRPATVSDLCTGKIPISRAEVRTLVGLAALASCSLDDLVLRGGLTGMLETGADPADIVKGKGLSQVSDEAALAAIVDAAIVANPKAVADIRAGNQRAVGFLAGAVMKDMKGKANMTVVQRLITERVK